MYNNKHHFHNLMHKIYKNTIFNNNNKFINSLNNNSQINNKIKFK